MLPDHSANSLPGLHCCFAGYSAGVDDTDIRFFPLRDRPELTAIQLPADRFGFGLIDFTAQSRDGISFLHFAVFAGFFQLTYYTQLSNSSPYHLLLHKGKQKMNRFAYRTTGLAVKALANLSRARITLHDSESIPKSAIIFVVNHFTRIETLLLPYHFNRLTGKPVWSLADAGLFKGALGTLLDKVGAVSTKNPDRDRLIVKSLLTGEAIWIIFPEGRMVKSKKIIEKGRFMISYAGGKSPPHTGAATLALRTEFYRRRLRRMMADMPQEAERLMALFQIEGIEPVLKQTTRIVPVNVTYYPIRARENILSEWAAKLVEDIPERALEELMTEGTMLLSGVDVDIRFGEPILVEDYMEDVLIRQDISKQSRIDFDDPIPSKEQMRKVSLKIMQRYMTDIYNMTTVNHDHLFASVLKRTPYRSLSEQALCRKVFLAATDGVRRAKVHLHKSLQDDQSHLLTDDRYRKCADFKAIAREKGMIRQKGNRLAKETRKLAFPFDFHRVRIDNPIAVMANAIEPLTKLQHAITRLSWLPDFIVRRRISKQLIQKGLAEYSEDYRLYYRKDETKPKRVGQPRLIKGRTRKTGILLLHGYMAAPLEMEELANYLGKLGYWVYVPRIRGHGTSPDDLAQTGVADWVASVDNGFALLDNACRDVIVGGFSNGGGLALDLAARIGGIRGVFAVCPPFKLMDLAAKFVPTVDRWNRFMEWVHLDSAKMEFVDNHPENPHINYTRNPISGVRALEELMDDLEPKLPQIKTPALVVQSKGDPVVNPKGSRQVFELLGSGDKEYLQFQLDRHGILLGKGSRPVHEAIGNFIKGL